MKNFDHIHVKLQYFIKKYYVNELIKGLILFSAFGFLYFILTLFIEYFFWLKPLARTILFWIFILVELLLFVRFIVIPSFKLMGIQKGISLEEASRLIGKHFIEIDDKLLNVLQLHKSSESSELLLASIEQKSINLKRVPFKRAISFHTNIKYLKFVIIPLIVWLVVYISGNNELFTASYDRFVHHYAIYEPPAPFLFSLNSSPLQVYENKSMTLDISIHGKFLPEEVQISYLDQNHYVKNSGNGHYEYTFYNVKESLSFSFNSNGVNSRDYFLEMIPTPTITSFEMLLDYPFYTNKEDELIKNTGNAIVPEGTNIVWNLKGSNTKTMNFTKDSVLQFAAKTESLYEYKEMALRTFDYVISSSNSFLKDYESMSYTIKVVKDAFPKIEVRSNIDSIARGAANFYGQLSDDYGISRLQLVYYNRDDTADVQTCLIPVNTSSFETFYYVFPASVDLEVGVAYEMYFEVFDNDGVIGSKSSRSKTFSYYNRTEDELQDKLLEEHQENIDKLQESMEENKSNKKDIENLRESLRNKSKMTWNEQKQLDNFIQRQKQYEQMMKKQTEELHQNLEEQPNSKNKELNDKKRDIQQRIKEAKELLKEEKLFKELRKLAEKLDKEELTEKLKELAETNRQNDRSLERLLELTKRFYVEQKLNQIKEKIDELSEAQSTLSESDKNSSEKQEKLTKRFKSIEGELDKLGMDNNELKTPMSLPDTNKEEKQISKEMNEAEDRLTESEKDTNERKEGKKEAAKMKQKSAAKKLKEMSQKMVGVMQSMSGQAMDEDIEMLRTVLENLVEFSFQQEDLMQDFSEITNAHPSFSNNLKKQQVLREYFEHIDDSLYTLSLRQPKIESEIFKDLSNVHYYMEEALIHFADNVVNVGLSDQQFVMTSTNNIASLLSEILSGMQNASASMGKGKGDGEKSFSLPDIIKKQGDAIEKLEEGMKKNAVHRKSGKEGERDEKDEEGKDGKNEKSSGEGEEMNGDLFEIYKQQSELRRQLEDGLQNKLGGEGKKAGENALKQMEELEQDLLEKGFTKETLQGMINLKYELLMLKEAAYQKGVDVKRESNNSNRYYPKPVIRDLNNEKLWFNENEILNRQSLPLRSNHRERVQFYFKVNDSIQ